MMHIKLDLDYEISNLGIIRFILIYCVLGLINWIYILVINLEILDYGIWYVRYFYWVIFVNLDPFIIGEIY